MRAAVIETQGEQKRIVVRELPAPQPGPADLLVRVHASSLNQADLRMAASHFGASEGPGATYPVGGLEFAGEVIGWGSEVEGFAEGDRVMAMAGGGWAEQAVVDHRLVLRVPDGYSWSEAAASSISFVTAHDALADAAGFVAGESVLVQGATTSAGLAAVQIARLLGASTVVGTTRQASSVDVLRQLGCDVPVCTSEADLVEAVRAATGDGVDVAIDVVGGATLDATIASTRIRGRVVSLGRVGGATGAIDLNEFARRRITMKGVTFRTRTLEERYAVIRRFTAEISPHLQSGALRPVLAAEVGLDDVVAAAELLSDRDAVGKLTVRVRVGATP